MISNRTFEFDAYGRPLHDTRGMTPTELQWQNAAISGIQLQRLHGIGEIPTAVTEGVATEDFLGQKLTGTDAERSLVKMTALTYALGGFALSRLTKSGLLGTAFFTAAIGFYGLSSAASDLEKKYTPQNTQK